VRPIVGRSGLLATCIRVELTRRGRDAGVVLNGIEMMFSIFLAADPLPGMGMLEERDGRVVIAATCSQGAEDGAQQGVA